MSNGLEALKKAWKQAKQEAKEYTNPVFNDGHYLTKIVKAEVGQSKAGKDQLVLDFQFIEGEYTGKSKRTWMNLDSSNVQGLAITIGTLERLGIQDAEPETLEEDIKTLLGKVVRIQLVTTISKKDGVTEYQNVRIEKVVGVDPDAKDSTPVEEPEVETEEEKPAKPAKKSKGSEEPEVEEEEEAVEEPAIEEESEEGVEIEIGMKVSFTKKDGSELEGEITAVDEENGKVVIAAKDTDGKAKKFKVDVDRVSAI